MTVAELKKKLEEFPDDLKVFYDDDDFELVGDFDLKILKPTDPWASYYSPKIVEDVLVIE